MAPVCGSQRRCLAIMHSLWLLDILPYLVYMPFKKGCPPLLFRELQNSQVLAALDVLTAAQINSYRFGDSSDLPPFAC